MSTESSAADAKRFISANELSTLAEELAYKIAKDYCFPSFMIVLWRGGCQPGSVVQEFLEYVNDRAPIDHVAVRTVSRNPYTGTPLPEIQVHAIGHAVATLKASDTLLIVDDVWDSGRSIHAVLNYLKKALGDDMPQTVKVATVFYKPKKNKFPQGPDYYVEATDAWLVFPHELVELNDEEVKLYRPNAYALAQKFNKEDRV